MVTTDAPDVGLAAFDVHGRSTWFHGRL